MKKTKAFIILFLFTVFYSCKKEQSVENSFTHHYVSKSEAIEISKIFENNNRKNSKEIDKIETLYDKNNMPALYIINYKNEGFLLVSGDEHFLPVLGYSDEKNFSFDNIPCNLQFVLNNFNNKVEEVRRNKIPVDSLIRLKWRYIRRPIGGGNGGGGTPGEPTPVPDPTDPPQPILISTVLISPLLQTTWGQGCGYNTMMPTLQCGPCQHAYTGCVTTAMAQIIKYHEYPQNFNWSAMPNNYGTTETAQLMGQIANSIPINDDYNCTTGTSAFLYNTESTFTNDFNYSGATYTDSPSPSYNIVTNNLSNNMPVLFGGSGHAWVCDGFREYEYNTGVDWYYHMNWGWDGNCDGFYSPNLFQTSNGNYTLMEMVYNIHP